MRVGSDVGAICRKCGDVWHVVVALIDGRVAQVECKQCGARHRYRSPDGGGTARAPGRSVVRRTPAKKAAKATLVEADPSRPVRRYDPREQYLTGDRVVHPTFGEGVVQAITGATKVRVRFASGEEKMLVQARSSA